MTQQHPTPPPPPGPPPASPPPGDRRGPERFAAPAPVVEPTSWATIAGASLALLALVVGVPVLLWALTGAITDAATVGNCEKLMDFVGRMPVEFQTVFMRSVIRRDEKLADTKTFNDWGVRHQDILI